MLPNSSSSTSDSIHLSISSTNYSFPLFMYCFILSPSSYTFTAFSVTYVLLVVPLNIVIFYHGLHESWRKSSTSSPARMSHSDCFTYHLATLDMIGVFGFILSLFGIYTEDLNILSWGLLLASFILNGETFFHLMMCVDRYLAVVHPITYLSLRTKRAMRLRNISIGCVWLLCFVGMGFLMFEKVFSTLDLFFLFLALIVASFCSLSILCVLIRPGPGEQGRRREKADQLKLRAFYSIVAILGVLVLRFACGLARAISFVSDAGPICTIMTSSFFFYLPSNLVTPALFLHRAGRKTVCCK